MSDQELIDFLNKNPNVKDKLKDLAKVSSNFNLEFTRGDDAKEAVINYSRELNKELLQTWGAAESSRVSGNVEAQIPTAKKHRLKKIKWHTRCGNIELLEHGYYSKRKWTIRAFQLSSGIRNHAYGPAHKVKARHSQHIATCPTSNLLGATQLISETDGSMVPIVIGNPRAKDKNQASCIP